MDSGCNLLWIPCAPCIKCRQQLTPLFDLSKSSSYRNLTCTSCYCRFDPEQTYCDSVGICAYNGNYVDTTSTKGNPWHGRGNGAKIDGYSTPIQVFLDRYYVTLEGISVGEKWLEIVPKAFIRGLSGVGGVIIFLE
ncbi:hypothetical protein ACSBR1_026166 [Camellia fascicularis]